VAAPPVRPEGDGGLARELLASALLILLLVGSTSGVLGAVWGVLWLLS
jgi:hypothetical protein